uniref:CCHC-type domain-containing protein n=1 Tax=Rhodnius prolixus TaxID=13249 RepID=T1HSC6_RHOPR
MGDIEQLKKEMAVLKQECDELRRLSLARSSTTTAQTSSAKRDLSLQSLIRPWGGGEDEEGVDIFLQNIELLAVSGGWTDDDLKLICRLKLTGAASACIAGHPELLEPAATFQDLKKVLRDRFDTLLSPAQRLLQLNSLVQRPDEGVLAFADRCRRLGEGTIPKSLTAEQSRYAREQAEQVLLAAYVKGLRGEPGLQLQYHPPTNFQDAVATAARIELAKAQVRMANQEVCAVQGLSGNETRFSRRGPCFKCREDGHAAKDCPGIQPGPESGSPSKRNARKGKRGACFVCGQQGHFARECPRRSNAANVCSCNSGVAELQAPNGKGPVEAPSTGTTRT